MIETPALNPTGFGTVTLVGAGPGAADLLTVRAVRAIERADVIFYDALVDAPVLALAGPAAQLVPVGKRKGCHSKSQDEINALLVAAARDGLAVVRLKAGDPLVFGRGGEEIAALREAGIAYSIVPGVTAATAAAADLALPLTLRGTASTLVFTTGHDLNGNLPDWARLALEGASVAVYMGRTVAARIAARLIDAGLGADTPVAAVEYAGRANARAFIGTLADLPALANRDDLTGPTLVIIGETVASADLSRAQPLRASTHPARDAVHV